jgi:hypothetical protein
MIVVVPTNQPTPTATERAIPGLLSSVLYYSWVQYDVSNSSRLCYHREGNTRQTEMVAATIGSNSKALLHRVWVMPDPDSSLQYQHSTNLTTFVGDCKNTCRELSRHMQYGCVSFGKQQGWGWQMTRRPTSWETEVPTSQLRSGFKALCYLSCE